MDTKILKFLKKERIGVLTTIIEGEQPHSATVHVAFNESPFYFVVWTGAKSRKLSNIKSGNISKGSLVIGFSEEEWLTMQMEGEVKWVSDSEELQEIWKCYAKKYDEGEKFEGGPDDALVKFTPTWWRFSKVNKPKFVISSED